mmetsp:Transcript_27340/g.55899  ORF Transcript_27340/g.55899 Transcript_27340/m.55899 type:complete len:255 (+) Transcript_27340:164-928(+)
MEAATPTDSTNPTRMARCHARRETSPRSRTLTLHTLARGPALVLLFVALLGRLAGFLHDPLHIVGRQTPARSRFLVVEGHVVFSKQHLVQPLPPPVVGPPCSLARRTRPKRLDGPPLEAGEGAQPSLDPARSPALFARRLLGLIASLDPVVRQYGVDRLLQPPGIEHGPCIEVHRLSAHPLASVLLRLFVRHVHSTSEWLELAVSFAAHNPPHCLSLFINTAGLLPIRSALRRSLVVFIFCRLSKPLTPIAGHV